MSKKQFAVIGHPIGHTMSPFIHNRLFALAGVEAEYHVMDIPPESLEQAVPELKKLDGFNITIPHKSAIIPFLDELDKKAAAYGSVNTVVNGETSVGYTTDGEGFAIALRENGIPLKGRVVILGSGGVARTMAYEALIAGCAVTLAVRPSDLLQAARLAGEILTTMHNPAISTCTIDRLEGKVDLLVNATPVGMYPEINAMPVSGVVLSHCASVFDAVYNPVETLLMKAARANGARVLGGMPMLVWQAAAAHNIWDGSTYKTSDIHELCEEAGAELARQFAE